MMETETQPRITAVLASVGGAPTPILHVLRQSRPPHVWYFCSIESRATADAIQKELDWQPQARFIEVAAYEELAPCYRAVRDRLREILAETKVPAAEVQVDYTGGTKTMSAALVLAAAEVFQQFSYVGGQQRAKGGLGVVLDGKERVLYQGNPWNELAIREIERARDLWSAHQFDIAARVLSEVAPRTQRARRFGALGKLAEALAARHRLDFKEARNLLGRLNNQWPDLFDGQEDFGLCAFSRGAFEICRACCEGAAHPRFLRELLDNALRTAAQGRYEDAAARLYRAMEMQGQIWLAEKTDHLFKNGTCAAARVAEIPSVLTDRHVFCRAPDGGDVRLSLEQIFRILATLDHAQAIRIVHDLDDSTAGGGHSRWRIATEKRNTSILAHGVLPIGETGFEQMRQLAAEFLGFDLAREANPIPPLDPRWFA